MEAFFKLKRELTAPPQELPAPAPLLPVTAVPFCLTHTDLAAASLGPAPSPIF